MLVLKNAQKKYFEKIEASRHPKPEKTKIQDTKMENIHITDMVSENITVIENSKSKRTRKKNDIKSEESEQID